MVDYLPASLRGLMLAGFLAAYMSTIGTQLNLGASYLTNDLYRRFIRPDATDAPLRDGIARDDRRCSVLAAAVTPLMHSVGDAWKYMLTMTAGRGAGDDPALVLVAHQRLERDLGAGVSAVVGSALYVVQRRSPGDDPNATAKRLLITVAITTVGWIAAHVCDPAGNRGDACPLLRTRAARTISAGSPIARIARPRRRATRWVSR